jgi:predicted DNA-binding transcriptional regulator YafY
LRHRRASCDLAAVAGDGLPKLRPERLPRGSLAISRYTAAGVNREKAFDIVRRGHTETFRLLHRAILAEKQVAFTYNGRHREVCPYILGHKDGAEKLLAFQFAGESGTGKLDWKCFEVAKVRDARMQDGPLHGSAKHRKTQRCVDDVFIDVNKAVPNQPGRR